MDADVRIGALQGEVLDAAPDGVLVAFAHEAALALGVRCVALSLLLRHTIVFRAFAGRLPAELTSSRVISHDLDPCRHVVERRAAIAIEDTHTSGLAPPTYARLGVRSYLGVPIAVGDVTVGVLAAYHDEPRVFDAGHRIVLEVIARKCEARLGILSRHRPPRRALIEEAASPAFAELRNTMMPLEANLLVARTALDALTTEAIRLRADAAGSVEALRDALNAIELHTKVVQRDLSALEGLFALGADHARVADIVRTSDRIAHHHTKLVGGVCWHHAAADVFVELTPATCIGVLAHGLSLVAMRVAAEPEPRGITGRTTSVDHGVIIEIGAEIGREPLRTCARILEDFVHHTRISIDTHHDALAIVLPAA